MRYTPQFSVNGKRLFKRTVALVCAVCFIAVFLLSAALFVAHSANETAVVCQRTLGPECKCESGGALAQAQTQIRPDARASAGASTRTQSHNSVGCLTCAMVLKTFEHLRHLNVAVSTITSADTGMLALAALCLLSLIPLLSTPIKLKIRIDN